MACAKKCDRCGKLYEQYNSKNDRKNPNGIMVLNLDSQRRYFTHNALDLCPDCMKGFQDWFGEVKQMERLTKISEIGNAYYPKCFEEPCCGMGECLDDKCSLMLDACKKLAEYEQLEEQGLLVRLPCPIGTTVWDIYGTGIRKNVVSGIEYGKDGRWFLWANEDEWLGELNVVVFLTREEAEKKLEEMKKNGE